MSCSKVKDIKLLIQKQQNEYIFVAGHNGMVGSAIVRKLKK